MSSSSAIQAVRGMNDVLPDEIAYWQHIETIWRRLMTQYAYQEIRFPLVEAASLFQRSVGETSDIVEKETYTFADRNGDLLTLRPEGTAVCVRALVQHSVLQQQPVQRLWYMGPMFRHERPQKGRYRQFHQLGLEAFGMHGAAIEAEILLLTTRLWQELGLSALFKLQINSLGTPGTRAAYRAALVAYFTQHHAQLDEDSQRRLDKNPLRILDSKNPAMTAVLQNVPQMTDYLDEVARAQLNQLCAYLDKAGIAYEINSRLVRGLDYYTGLVFEWVTEHLGAQATVCGGGRYDNLVAELGGPASEAVGFSIGMERLILLLQAQQNLSSPVPDVYLLNVGELAEQNALKLAEDLRLALPDLSLLVHCGGGGFKSQFKKADKSGAKIALILGDDEAKQTTVTVKYLREEREQVTVPQYEMVEFFKKELGLRIED